jgi:hypothetical protein
MDPTDTYRHLSFDLLQTDLDDPERITELVARHAVAPARAIFGMVPPEPNERIETFLSRGHFAFDLASGQPTWHQDPSAALIEPALRGAVLVSRLFPGAFRTAEFAEVVVATPGLALMPRATAVAILQWKEIAFLAARALGLPAERPLVSGSLAKELTTSRHGIDELRRMKVLVERALAEPIFDESDGMVARDEVGLDAVLPTVADELDAILRADAHVRLVRVTDIEHTPSDRLPVHPDAPDEYDPLVVERGVFPITLPETIAGLVALDLVESFRRGRTTGICALCQRPMLLLPQQASLSRRGEPVYHPDCFPERRRRYMRDYRAGRVGAGRAKGEA